MFIIDFPLVIKATKHVFIITLSILIHIINDLLLYILG
jgi:hypothetical protein